MTERPKLNIFCSLSKQNVFGPLFFARHNVTGIEYLGIPHAPILVEEGSDNMPLQDKTASSFL